MSPAPAHAAERTDCDGIAGREMLTCIEERWPKVSTTVEGTCKDAEKPRDCRVTEHAAHRITFVPGSKDGGGGSKSKSSGKAASADVSAPEYVNIRFVGAQIGPGKAGRNNWDGTGSIPPRDTRCVARGGWCRGNGDLRGAERRSPGHRGAGCHRLRPHRGSNKNGPRHDGGYPDGAGQQRDARRKRRERRKHEGIQPRALSARILR